MSEPDRYYGWATNLSQSATRTQRVFLRYVYLHGPDTRTHDDLSNVTQEAPAEHFSMHRSSDGKYKTQFNERKHNQKADEKSL